MRDMDRTGTLHHRPSLLPPAATLVAAPLDSQTYRNLGYLLLSLPLGMAYFAFLVVGFGLVPGAASGMSAWLVAGGGPVALAGAALCLAAGVVALPAMLPVIEAVRRLTGFERRLTGYLLGGAVARTSEAAPVAAEGGPWRRLTLLSRDLGMFRGLTFLAVKAPLAVLGSAVVAAAAVLIGLLVLAPVLVTTPTFGDLYAAVQIGPGLDAWLCVLVAFPVLGLAVQAINGLAWVANELARLLLASPDVARFEWATDSTTR